MKYSLLTLLIFLKSSILYSQFGPGGVGRTDGTSSLEGWYKYETGIEESPGDIAEIGDQVNAWLDASGNNNDLGIIGTDDSPEFVNYLGFNCLEFAQALGNERQMASLSPTGNQVSDVSIFSVYAALNASGDTRPVAICTDPAWAAGAGPNLGQACDNSIRRDNGSVGGSITGSSNEIKLRSTLMEPGILEDFVDGASNINSTGSFTTQNNTLFRIGHIRNKNNTPYVYETMYFSEKVNEAQRIIIDNYLSAKFSTSLNAVDVYNEDDPAAGNFDHEVAGIGRVDANNIHDDAQGTSIVRILNPSDLNDDEFLMWGHDNGSFSLTTNDIPTPLVNRLSKTWKASEMNSNQVAVDVGCVDIRFDLTGLGVFTADELVLLVDGNLDGQFNNEIPIPGAVDLGNNVYEFPSMSCISDNVRFTIGVLSPTYVFPDTANIAASSLTTCESYDVDFSINSNVFDQVVSVDWDFGDGTLISSDVTETHAYTSAGTFQVNALIHYPCYDYETSIDIEVFPHYDTIETHTACGSYTWIDGITYTASNNSATHTYQTIQGCDSVITLNLTIDAFTTGVDVQTSCDAYTWIDGNTYTTSNNTATHTLVGASGCDSIVTLDLTIYSSSNTISTYTECSEFTWIDGVTYTTSNNTATHLLQSINGCDSLITLNLTILGNTIGTDTHEACDSFTWIDGISYTTSNNTATHTLVSSTGCDSLITLDLTINNSVNSIDQQSECGSYTWIDGITYTESNNSATVTLVSASGCDSIVTLDLTIQPEIDLDLGDDITICEQTVTLSAGQYATYDWSDGTSGPSIDISIAGTYGVMVTDVDGCTGYDEVQVIEDCPFTLWVPNIFTPNGDGINEEFKVISTNLESLEVMIFNRWGMLLDSWEDPSKAWSGNNKYGVPVPEGVYLYVVDYTYFENGIPVHSSKTGHVSIIR